MSALEERVAAEPVTEIHHLTMPVAFVYKVPPLKSSATGHRAESWGLGSPMLTARLELVGVGTTMEVRLFDDSKDAQKVVACCAVHCARGSAPIELVVDPVVDSSRYFVLRCENKEGKVAYIGVGFAERESAYDFKAALQDFKRCIEREFEAAKKTAEYERNEETDPSLNDVDLSLKGSIKIRLGEDKGDTGDEDAAEKRPAAEPGGPMPTFAPPPEYVPPAPFVRPALPPAAPAAAPAVQGDWASFETDAAPPVETDAAPPVETDAAPGPVPEGSPRAAAELDDFGDFESATIAA